MSAAVGIFYNDSLDLYYVALRALDDKKHPNVWEFPGGTVEHGETPFDTLRREMWEEVNVRLVFADTVLTIRNPFSKPDETDNNVTFFKIHNCNPASVVHRYELWLPASVIPTLNTIHPTMLVALKRAEEYK